jgi:hypothetical protein
MSQPPLDRRSILEAAEEAKRLPTSFAAKDRARYVESQVNTVRTLVAMHKTDSEIKEFVGTFPTEYPTLFEYALKPNFDQNNLRIMLGLLDRMGDKQMSQHQASVIVGQRMADRYIKTDSQQAPQTYEF